MSTYPPTSCALKQEPNEENTRDTMVDEHEIPEMGHHYIDDELEELPPDVLMEDDESNPPADYPPEEKSHIRLTTRSHTDRILKAAEEWYSNKKSIAIQKARNELFINLAAGIFRPIYEPLSQRQNPTEFLIRNRWEEGINYLEKMKEHNSEGAFPDSLIKQLQDILNNGDWRTIHGIVEMSDQCRTLLLYPQRSNIQQGPKIHIR